ncbi:uncharacterized protein [Parasteatoda tepidariorum]|uniref:uncharacterized protein n=1 Tax=Parasteatoda tepidariorum TaxID=114398 RepID=UPI00077F97A4|nr:uncharacterized protein LOC107445791 [Parasteatoda tepidariorum]
MASLEESLLASAMEVLNIEDYWPTFDSNKALDLDDDSEYSIILYFYERLLDALMQYRCVQPEHVQQAIKTLVYNYGRVTNGKTPEDLDYNKFSNCVGYLHRYAACHTALVHTVMLKIFHTSPPAAIRRMLALKDQLGLMCLGSGPGNDFVGVLSALYGKHYGLLNLDISVVDKMSGWQQIFVETEKRLRRGDCGNASNIFKEVAVSASFLQADLKNPSQWNAEFKRKLSNADIITLVKFLSVVPNADKLSVLKNIVVPMKPGAVIVLIDCPYPSSEFETLKNYLDCVYEATKEKFNFNFQVERFGYPNITTCRAVIRVFVRKFVVAGSES